MDIWFSRLKVVEFTPRRTAGSAQTAGNGNALLEGSGRPNGLLGQGKRTAWIDPDNGVTMESETYDDSGKVIMKQKVKKVEKINGVGMTTEAETESENVNGKSRSTMKMEKVEINRP